MLISSSVLSLLSTQNWHRKVRQPAHLHASFSMDGHSREGKSRAWRLMITVATVLLLQLACSTLNVVIAYDFYVWNGLPVDLRVGDQKPDASPGTFISYTKDEIDADFVEFMAPVNAGLEDEFCEVGIHMLVQAFNLRENAWVVYVYTTGFFPASDSRGTGNPVQYWPSQNDACLIATQT